MTDLTVKTDNGQIIAHSYDTEDYIGVMAEYVDNKDNGQYDLRPTVRIECNKETPSEIQVLVYDSNNEDAKIDIMYENDGKGRFTINEPNGVFVTNDVIDKIRDAYTSNLDVLHEMGDDDGSEDTHDSGYKTAIEFIAKLAGFSLT